jgi:hypothetical protein
MPMSSRPRDAREIDEHVHIGRSSQRARAAHG